MSTVQRSSAHPSNSNVNGTRNGETTVSFVEGTPSSRSSGTASTAKRDRKRSSSGSPRQGAGGIAGLAPAPVHAASRTARVIEEKQTDAEAKRNTDRCILRQYIAFQPPASHSHTAFTSLQHQQPEDWQERINESVQREAEYLLDEGSQLVKGEVRDAITRASGGGRLLLHADGIRGGEDEVQWRNVVVPCLTMDDIQLSGKSWTYQPPPPSGSAALDPAFAALRGTITGIPLADLPEWTRFDDVEEAFSPVRRLQGPVPLPPHETTNGEEGQDLVDKMAGGGLGSPFDSQQERAKRGKRKADDLTRNDPPLPPRVSETRSPPLPEYVPVNDLPEWEWWFEPAPPALGSESAAGQENESQSQSIRESLRRSYNDDDDDDDDGRRSRRPEKQIGFGEMHSSTTNMSTTTRTTTNATNVGAKDYSHTKTRRTVMLMASYVTDPSMAATSTPTSDGDETSTVGVVRDTAYEADGRIFRRMPVVLPNLDHEKMKVAAHEKRETGVGSGPGKTKGAVLKGKKGGKAQLQVEGAANKRVMQLQGGQQQVRPIKSFLPMPLLGAPEQPEGLQSATQAIEATATGNDTIMDIDDISMAKSTHNGHHSTVVNAQEELSAFVAPPTILVEGEPAVLPSPGPIASPSTSAVSTPVVVSKEEMRRRRILGDPGRYGQHYGIIEEPHFLRILNEPATHVHIPPALQSIEPIPPLPTQDHPFHPSLEYYIARRPYARVKWLIPVHGPVIVPGLSEGREWEDFWPSDGHLALSNDEYREVRRRCRQIAPPVASSSTPAERNRPRPLILTEQLLREIWNKLVRLRKLGRFGDIALALSSSQPDPFRPTERNHAPILERHQCIPPFPAEESAHDNDARPVKPEVGDHIKLFCNLRYAMAIRFVLKGIELGDDGDSASRSTLGGRIDSAIQDAPQVQTGCTQLAPTLSSGTTRSAKSASRSLVPFRGVKLCLVGDKGEVLTVV
ncbi:hypothetical protein QFC21_002488 [Naganishia friedmannii]|uniref:Uncharacterized protein n=1 Tax=Naganishia friedmannii TaxID=89922 RepID=A0ACC2VWA5_9TREE|nr:hypothetical protein QFC21_002488 [Naganishia friedmannii]